MTPPAPERRAARSLRRAALPALALLVAATAPGCVPAPPSDDPRADKSVFRENRRQDDED